MEPNEKRARVVGVLALAVTVGAGVVTVAPPALALNQYCGASAFDVGVNYAAGSLDNGHPANEAEGGRDGWSGLAAVKNAKIADLAVDSALAVAADASDLIESFEFGAQKTALIATTVLQVALTAAKVATAATLLQLEQQNDLVNVCSSTLGADMTDVIFVAMQEEELANLDPTGAVDSSDGSPVPAGVRLAPTGVFLLPDDGLPAWQRDAAKYGSYGGHAELGEVYPDGFLDGANIGIAVLVRNQIAHLEAHGISTGGGRVWDPVKRRYVTKPGAREEWANAMAELGTGDLRAAYAGFARAYQLAVQTTTTP